MQTLIDKQIELLSGITKVQKERRAINLSTISNDNEFMRQQEKIFKPIVDVAKTTNKHLEANGTTVDTKLQAIENGVQGNSTKTDVFLTKLDTVSKDFTQLAEVHKQLAIQGIPEAVRNLYTLGPLATKYLPIVMQDSMGMKYDKKDGQHKIGGYPVAFEGNAIIIKGQKYEASEGLWELLTQTDIKKSDDGKTYKYVNIQDVKMYRKIIIEETQACFLDDGKPRSSINYKYLRFIKPILDKRKGIGRSHSESEVDNALTESISGAGIVTKFIPDTPKYLIERLHTLVGHKQSGHTIDFSEAYTILDMMRSRKILSQREHKKAYEYFA